MRKILLIAAFLLISIPTAYAEDKPIFMSTDWAKAALDAWNNDPTLTVELFKSGWVTNTKDGRGFKVIEIYREDCLKSQHIQLKMEAKDGKAVCVYGGEVVDKEPDYIMWAKTSRWIEMGKGEYGPMKAMMFNRLRFKGPMWEAMNNMGPFSAFLLLTGKIDSNFESCH
ncbi:MAG: SCP2 sterol-binding domain-containing protein [Nitrospinae bacterium]|nr:SCP2 sterol-binding domain-containing protein [Nitrospinota bacterium]